MVARNRTRYKNRSPRQPRKPGAVPGDGSDRAAAAVHRVRPHVPCTRGTNVLIENRGEVFERTTWQLVFSLSRPESEETYSRSSRKEVIQPQVPLRLPCYDFAPVTDLAFGRSLLAVGTRTSGTTGFHGVTGGVYKARERIHRGVADPRLLAIPPSCSRVADCNPNLDRLFGIRSLSRVCSPLCRPL